MREVFDNNRLYFGCLLFFGLLGALALLWLQKGNLVLYFAVDRNPQVDNFALYGTRLGEEWPYVVAFFALLFVRFRYALLIPVLAGLATLISQGLKYLLAQPRPRTFFYKLIDSGEITFVAGLDMHGGYNSLPSGHSIAAFTLYTFLALCINNRWWQLVCFGTAITASISRIILTQHFLEDVYLGAVCGITLAVSIFYLQARPTYQTSVWHNRSLLSLQKKKTE